jgi:steroid delta-isomerase-like uncharacterized protein
MPMNKSDILKQHLDALNKKDWKAYAEGFTDNVAYEEEATRRKTSGRDEYVKLVKEWANAFPDLKAAIKDVVMSGDAAVAELEWSGTHKGALSGPMGNIPPTNKSGKVAAVLVARFDGDKIREAHHYFDLMTLLAQLGVLPQRPGAQPSP